MKKKVVCIGGGTGQASVLSSLKEISYLDLVSIVGVTDNGGYSGVIREAMGIPQPGDSRNCIGALSDTNLITSQLVNFRFKEGALSGISLGNLIIAALTRITGDFSEAVKKTGELAGVAGKVLPVTTQSTHICAELANGSIISGEWEIIKRTSKSKITKLFLQDEAEATKEVMDEIRDADLIIICPGSLCTAIISALLAKGVSEAISESKGKLVYICNIMTQKGQTEGFSISDHVNFIQNYISRYIDYVIVNKTFPSNQLVEHYKKENSFPIVIDNKVKNSNTQIIMEDLLLDLDIESLKQNERPKSKGMHVSSHLIRHAPEKLMNVLKRFL